MALRVGQQVWIRCRVQPGPFSDESLVTIETIEGPVAGFIDTDELRKGPPGSEQSVRGVVRSIEKTFVEVWIRGSFFTTNGLANVRPELAMAA